LVSTDIDTGILNHVPYLSVVLLMNLQVI